MTLPLATAVVLVLMTVALIVSVVLTGLHMKTRHTLPLPHQLSHSTEALSHAHRNLQLIADARSMREKPLSAEVRSAEVPKIMNAKLKFEIVPLSLSMPEAGRLNLNKLMLRSGQGSTDKSLTAVSSTNWSGYAVPTAVGASTYVYGSWTIPSIVPNGVGDKYSSSWVGLDGYSSPTVQQIGTASESRGRYVWFEMYPLPPYQIRNFPISPGDRFQASVRCTQVGSTTRPTVFRMVISNMTRNVAFEVPARYTTIAAGQTPKLSSAEWVVEAPSSGSTGQVLPLAKFTPPIGWSGCRATVSGQTRVLAPAVPWTVSRITMVSDAPVRTRARVSSALDQQGRFAVTWVDS